MTHDEDRVFNIIGSCETSTYECMYAPDRAVVSTREIAKITGWTMCRTRKALHGLVSQELIERASQGQPAVESCGEYRELVCEAAPPKNGYAISKKGFESAIWKKICARWERSMAEYANGG